jgi:hypothetical protein
MKTNVKEVINKGSTSVEKAVKTLKTKGTVTVNENTFKKVLTAIRTTYANMIANKAVTVNYGNFEITLN